MRTLKQTQLKFDIPDEKSVFYVLFYPSLLLVSYIRTRKRCESSSVIVNRPNSISDLALLIKLRSHTTTTYIYIYIFVHQPIVLPEFSVSVYPSIRPQKLLVTIAWRVSSQSLSLSLNKKNENIRKHLPKVFCKSWSQNCCYLFVDWVVIFKK
jgi:hypothetical protein